jgi:hypothetical protein
MGRFCVLSAAQFRLHSLLRDAMRWLAQTADSLALKSKKTRGLSPLPGHEVPR